MIDTPNLPPELRAWLHDVERRLHALPDDQRTETLSGLAEHVVELTDSGLSGAEAVARLGSPASVAEDAFAEYQQQTGRDLRGRYFTVKRVLQLAAFVLAVAAAAVVAFRPSFILVTTDSDGIEQIQAATVLEVVGLWYLLVLAIPVVLTAVPLFARGRAWQPVSIACVVPLTVFVAIGMLSISWDFLLAWVVAVVAVLLPARPR